MSLAPLHNTQPGFAYDEVCSFFVAHIITPAVIACIIVALGVMLYTGGSIGEMQNGSIDAVTVQALLMVS